MVFHAGFISRHKLSAGDIQKSFSGSARKNWRYLMTHEVLVHAIAATTIGIPVGPAYGIRLHKCDCGRQCGSEGKHPIHRSGIKSATTDADEIRRYWESHPNANLMIATGKVSGVCVIDIDLGPDKDGEVELRKLEKEHGLLPETLRVNTGSGGFHLYFRVPKGVSIKCSVSKLAPGIDVRGDGGYVIGPGSTHLSGRQYKISGLKPFTLDNIAPLPSWIIERLNNNKTTTVVDTGTPSSSSSLQGCDCWEHRRLQDYCRAISSAISGCQEVTLNNLAFEMGLILRNGHLTRQQVERDLIDAGNKMQNASNKQAWHPEMITKKILRAVNDGLHSLSDRVIELPESLPNRHSEILLTIGSETDLARQISRDFSRNDEQWVFDEGQFWRYVKTHWELVSPNTINMIIREHDGTKIKGRSSFF